MKFESAKNVFQGAVHGQVDVSLSLEPGEAQSLRTALALVHRYEKAALDAVCDNKIEGVQHPDPRTSEWHMVSYAVKNDKVIV